MEGTQVLIARVRRAGMPRPDKIPWSALLPSIHALFESVYGKKEKKALPLLHCARSGKREMYFFWAHCPFSPHGGIDQSLIGSLYENSLWANFESTFA